MEQEEDDGVVVEFASPACMELLASIREHGDAHVANFNAEQCRETLKSLGVAEPEKDDVKAKQQVKAVIYYILLCTRHTRGVLQTSMCHTTNDVVLFFSSLSLSVILTCVTMCTRKISIAIDLVDLIVVRRSNR